MHETHWTHAGLSVKIKRDETPETPRAWDNLGVMACWHSKYDLGDKEHLSLEEIRTGAADGSLFVLPLYLYDHSGLTIQTTPFSCPWDSGQVGYVYADRAQALREFDSDEKVLACLRAEVATYDEYLRGEVYGFEIEDDEGNHLDSCWGFYGSDEEDLRETANNAAVSAAADLKRKREGWYDNLILPGLEVTA